MRMEVQSKANLYEVLPETTTKSLHVGGKEPNYFWQHIESYCIRTVHGFQQ